MARRSPQPGSSRAGVSGFEQRLLRRFRSLPAPLDGPLVVGFSGGVDSLALLGALARLRPSLDRTVLAIHVDHGLRPDSAADARSAAILAQRLDVPWIGRRIEGELGVLHPGVGVEEAARRERYSILERVAGGCPGSLICIAHHEQDQAETVLLHLLRGAGLRGASGMAELVDLSIPWWEDGQRASRRTTIWRPLLGESRSTLVAFVERLGLEPVVDPSNENPAFRRNQVRAGMLPCLAEAWSGATSALARFAELAAEDDQALEAWAAAATEAAVTPEGRLPRAALANHPLAIKRRIIRRWIATTRPWLELTSERVDAVLDLAASAEGGRRLEIGDRLLVEARGGELRLVET